MKTTTNDLDSIEDIPTQLSVWDLDDPPVTPKSTKTKSTKKKSLREQVSRPPKNAVKIKAEPIDTHFRAALIMTIFCFFIVGPCWALWKSFRVRKLVEDGQLEEADKLSHRISTVLMVSLIIGIFAWVGILFCSVGLILTGVLIRSRAV